MVKRNQETNEKFDGTEEALKKAAVENKEAEDMLGAAPSVAVPSMVVANPRIGTFKNIGEVLPSDIVEANLINLVRLFERAGWEAMIKPGVLDRIVVVLKDTIAANAPYTEIAKKVMFHRSPVLLALTEAEQFVMFREVLFSLRAVYTTVSNPLMYYRLYVEFVQYMRDKNNAVTYHNRINSRMTESKPVHVFKQQLKCPKGVTYGVIDKFATPDYAKLNLSLENNEETVNELQAENWVTMDALIENYYIVNAEAYNEYAALPAEEKVIYEKPSVFAPKTYFDPYNFDFEQLEDLRNHGVLVFTGVPSTNLFDSACTYPANEQGEMDLFTRFYFRKLSMAAKAVKDGTTPDPIKFMKITKIPIKSAPIMPSKPTEKDRSAALQVMNDNAAAYAAMRMLFKMEFRNFGKRIEIPEKTHYPPPYVVKFGTTLGKSAPNPGTRAQVEGAPKGFFAKVIWKLAENEAENDKLRDEIMKKSNAKYTTAENKKKALIEMIEFDAPEIDTQRMDALIKKRAEAGSNAPKSNFTPMKPSFLNSTIVSVKTLPAMGDQSNETDGTKFNNSEFKQIVYITGTYVPPASNDAAQEEANAMA
jgi:hypothetical protein